MDSPSFINKVLYVVALVAWSVIYVDMTYWRP